MTLRTKVITLGLLLAAMSAVALIDRVAIDWYPPAGTAQDGRAVAYAPGDVRDCIGARAFSSLGDATSTRLWNACAASFARTGSLAGFTWRYWTLVASCALVLVSLLASVLIGLALAAHHLGVGPGQRQQQSAEKRRRQHDLQQRVTPGPHATSSSMR